MTVSYSTLPIGYFTHAIITGKPMAFSRWGNSEWASVLDWPSPDVDGRPYYDDHREAMRGILRRRPQYLLGMQPYAPTHRDHGRFMGEEIEIFLNQPEYSGLEWVDADVFHNLIRTRAIEPLLYAIHRRPFLMVGNYKHRVLHDFLRYAAFVEVPWVDAWLAKDRLREEILHALSPLPGPVVVGFSAGMTANVLIDELRDTVGQEHLLIDFGALWDPFAGYVSREYMTPQAEWCVQKSGLSPKTLAAVSSQKSANSLSGRRLIRIPLRVPVRRRVRNAYRPGGRSTPPPRTKE